MGIVAAVSAGVGVFIESGDSVGAWMDAVSIYIIPLGALLAGIIFYWVCPKGFAREQVETGGEKASRNMVRAGDEVCIRRDYPGGVRAWNLLWRNRIEQEI